MLREMILRLADLPGNDARDDHVDRLVGVMLDELALMPPEGLELPVSDHPKIASIVAALSPTRATAVLWANAPSMSPSASDR